MATFRKSDNVREILQIQVPLRFATSFFFSSTFLLNTSTSSCFSRTSSRVISSSSQTRYFFILDILRTMNFEHKIKQILMGYAAKCE